MDVEKTLGVLGENIRYLRVRQFMTQVQLAERLNALKHRKISSRMISNWERSKDVPDLVIIIEIGHILRVSFERLLCGTGLLSNDRSLTFDVNRAARSLKIQQAIIELVNKSFSAGVRRRERQDGWWFRREDVERLIYWNTPDELGLHPHQLLQVFHHFANLDPRSTTQNVLKSKTTMGKFPFHLETSWVTVWNHPTPRNKTTEHLCH